MVGRDWKSEHLHPQAGMCDGATLWRERQSGRANRPGNSGGVPWRRTLEDSGLIKGRGIDRIACALARSPARVDGRVFTAQQALANGLVDEIGYLSGAVSWIEKAGGLTQARLVRYVRGGGYLPGIYALGDGKGGGGVEVNLLKMDLQTVLPGSGPVFMYLWAPELAPRGMP